MATIITKNSSTASAVPLAADLVQGELAVNVTDKRVYTKNASAAVIEVGTNPSTITTTTVNGLTVGKGAGSVATNTAVGASALAANTTGDSLVAVGLYSLASNTSGNYNSAVGRGALTSNTTGSSNVGVGMQALASNTTASYNTAVGYQAGYSNTTGADITAVGFQSGYTNTTGTDCTYIGLQAGYSSNANSNTFVGVSSGYSVTSGAKNTILGRYNGNQGGLDIRTASNYIVLSDGDGNPRGIFDSSGNLLVGTTAAISSSKIGVSAGLNTYNMLVLKNTDAQSSGQLFELFLNSSGNTAGSIGHTGTTTVAYTTSSDYRLKENVQPMTGALAAVSQLKPVTYDWIEDKSKGQGFIAHELQAVVPDCVIGEKDAVDADGNPIYQGIDTSFLVATLTAAIQELNAKVDAQAAEIAALKGQA